MAIVNHLYNQTTQADTDVPIKDTKMHTNSFIKDSFRITTIDLVPIGHLLSVLLKDKPRLLHNTNNLGF